MTIGPTHVHDCSACDAGESLELAQMYVGLLLSELGMHGQALGKGPRQIKPKAGRSLVVFDA